MPPKQDRKPVKGESGVQGTGINTGERCREIPEYHEGRSQENTVHQTQRMGSGTQALVTSSPTAGVPSL